MSDKPHVTIVCDGGCVPNPGNGGYGVILVYGERQKELYGSEPNTSNNRMEIRAAIAGLMALKTPCVVEVVSDSQYLVNTMMQGWSRKANTDLWAELDAACTLHEVTFTWVRGHNGHPLNERAHVLAMRGIAELERAS